VVPSSKRRVLSSHVHFQMLKKVVIFPKFKVIRIWKLKTYQNCKGSFLWINTPNKILMNIYLPRGEWDQHPNSTRKGCVHKWIVSSRNETCFLKENNNSNFVTRSKKVQFYLKRNNSLPYVEWTNAISFLWCSTQKSSIPEWFCTCGIFFHIVADVCWKSKK